MRRAPRDLNLDPQITFVRETHVKSGRLSDNRPVDLHMLDQVTCAETSVFLIRDGRDQNITAQASLRICQSLRRRHASREASFHIERAAAIQFPVANRPRKWFCHSGDVYSVTVRIQHQTAPAGRSLKPP